MQEAIFSNYTFGWGGKYFLFLIVEIWANFLIYSVEQIGAFERFLNVKLIVRSWFITLFFRELDKLSTPIFSTNFHILIDFY